MSNASIPNQATEPNQDIISSEQAQVNKPTNPGGSAVLDGNIAAGESTNPNAEAIANPIATNFSSETGKADAKTAEVSTVAEP